MKVQLFVRICLCQVPISTARMGYNKMNISNFRACYWYYMFFV